MVPAYNEEVLIGSTLEGVPGYVDRVYVVDDGSVDNTCSVMEDVARGDERMLVVNHNPNRGVGASIVTGYKKALEEGMDVMVVMAGDNQMDPSWLTSLLDPVVEGRADYSKGNRLASLEYTRGMSRWRLLGNAVLSFLTKISSGYWGMVDPQNGYTAISRRALEAIDLDRVYPGYGYCNDLLVRLNVHSFRVVDVPVPARYGREKSKIRYSSYIVKVSWLLLRNFFWRIWMKYLVLGFSPVFILYVLGLVLAPVGFLLFIVGLFMPTLAQSLFIRQVVSTAIFSVGAMFLLFAMLFDIQLSRNGLNS